MSTAKVVAPTSRGRDAASRGHTSTSRGHTSTSRGRASTSRGRGSTSRRPKAADAEPEVLISRDGPLVTLTLNRPDRLNAVNLRLYERLAVTLEDADRDPEVRCVILTGQGRAFCAGADLKAHAGGPPSPEQQSRYVRAAQWANRLIQTIETPVVAAVNGHAVGAGLELALSADFAVVAEDAKLRLPEVALGTFVGGGVVYTLAERVGVLKARELVYLGDFFSGAEAAAMGVVSRAVPMEEVATAARELAERLARRAPIPLAAAKHLIGPAGIAGRREAMRREQEALERIFQTEDWQEGVAAYHAKHPPRFRGR